MTTKKRARSAKSKGGRPFQDPTKKQSAEIIEGLRMGLSVTMAARRAGLHHSRVFRWLAAAKIADPRRKCAEFAVVAYQADTELPVQLLKLIHKAAEDRWQAAAWLLERRYGYKTGARPDLEMEAGIAAAEAAGVGDQTEAQELTDLKTHIAEVETLRKAAQGSGSFVAAASVLAKEGELRAHLAATVSRLKEEADTQADAGSMVADVVADLRELPEHLQRQIVSGLGPTVDA